MGFFKNLLTNITTTKRVSTVQMVQERGNGFYSYNGKMYQSDIVRACIRPKIKAIGKLTAKHIRETVTASARKLAVNPEPYIRFLLEEPNQYMTGQLLQEKLAAQLVLNNNAFASGMKTACRTQFSRSRPCRQTLSMTRAEICI